MKALFKHILSLFMCICLLTAYTGVPLYAHSCTMDGHKEVSILPVKSCCGHEMAETTSTNCLSSASCCTFETSLAKSDVPAYRTMQIQVPQLTAIQLIVLSSLISITEETNLSTYFAESGPPLPHGRDLLSLIQVMRN